MTEAIILAVIQTVGVLAGVVLGASIVYRIGHGLPPVPPLRRPRVRVSGSEAMDETNGKAKARRL